MSGTQRHLAYFASNPQKRQPSKPLSTSGFLFFKSTITRATDEHLRLSQRVIRGKGFEYTLLNISEPNKKVIASIWSTIFAKLCLILH